MKCIPCSCISGQVIISFSSIKPIATSGMCLQFPLSIPYPETRYHRYCPTSQVRSSGAPRCSSGLEPLTRVGKIKCKFGWAACASRQGLVCDFFWWPCTKLLFALFSIWKYLSQAGAELRTVVKAPHMAEFVDNYIIDQSQRQRRDMWWQS